ncbi:Yip1 family protein [Desulfotomaculum copahuensis]|uniref:Yip1 domain-containing protein n=1 Tax=Desulfotomaculum copahuensis TaxID=1838280 RepID=A0A1B7LB66_9FIRM|nr:Yip1 family protein [Desulfotomaculum copahuensis]OAT79753.1 hypothetical protein A6M21_14965 [Desulfotomaculum copahuensis]
MENQSLDFAGEKDAADHGTQDSYPHHDQSGAGRPDGVPEPPGPGRTGFLELVYGVLFDPASTFRRVAAGPPLGTAVLVFTLVNLISALMSALLAHRLAYRGPNGMHMAWLMQAATPVLAATGLVLQYVKWYVFSALIHLTAGLTGGRGRAAGTLTVVALSVLPSIILVPVDLILLLAGLHGPAVTVVMILLGLLILVWSVVLVVLGLREVHAISTGQSLIAVLLPPLVLLVILFVLLLLAAAGVASLMPLAVPRY